MIVRVPYGNTVWEEEVAAIQEADAVGPAESIESLADPEQALRTALQSPIGSPRLKEIVQSRDSVAVIISDATRPSPSRIMLDALVEVFQEASVPLEHLTVIVGTGTHRAATADELEAVVGVHNLARLRVVNHDCRAQDLVHLGDTPRGIPVWINRIVAEADVRVATGCITPHHIVGFSGGRKAILPGVAGELTVSRHHSYPIYPLEPAHGWMQDNPAHEEALFAAQLVGVDFLVNAVPDPWGKGYLGFACGDLEAAHRAGVELCQRASRAPLSSLADLSIVSPGGYPRDINLHQAQKALSVAERITRPGGVIILVAECSRGAGSQFAQWLEEAASPEEMIETFKRSGWVKASGKAMMFARAANRHRVIVVSPAFDEATLSRWFMYKADSLTAAVAIAGQTLGGHFSTLIVPRASGLIPAVNSGGTFTGRDETFYTTKDRASTDQPRAIP